MNEERPQIQVEEPQLPTELWSEVVKGLWVGGCADADTTQGLMKGEIKPKPIPKKQFDTVITLYADANPVSWEVKELRYGYYDAPTMEGIDIATIDQIVDIAHADWKAGKKVLFRCAAGLNRSAMCAALCIIKSGFTPDEAINLIREKRSKYCLFNKTFEGYVQTRAALNKAS